MATLYTIGFTKRSAKDFFSTLQAHRIVKIIDIRLHNSSQLAGYTKKEDLAYFLETIANIQYTHDILLAPTEELLQAIQKKTIQWREYEEKFLKLLRERNVEQKYDEHSLHQACLLCSEHKPIYCHRKLVAEYFSKFYPISIVHL